MSDELTIGEKAISDLDWSLDPLRRLTQMSNARDFLDYKMEQAVREARTETRWKERFFDHVNGETRSVDSFHIASWKMVADALGISRQAAHRKYAHTID